MLPPFNLIWTTIHYRQNTVKHLNFIHDYAERYLSKVILFNEGVLTHLAIWHEPGHPEPWIIAMNDPPNRTTVQDYACRWGIEPMFSDFKSRSFQLEDTQLRAADRLDRLLLIMALAMYWCVRVGQEEARDHPTPLEKKLKRKPIPSVRPLENSPAAPFPGSRAVYGCWKGDFRWNSPYPALRPTQLTWRKTAGKATSDGTPLIPLLPNLPRDEELIGGKLRPLNQPTENIDGP